MRNPAKCGTPGGYTRHHINRTRPCDACKNAARRWFAEWQRAAREGRLDMFTKDAR